MGTFITIFTLTLQKNLRGTLTSHRTAPDPIGDAGGDNDWYGYCLDAPVNRIDIIGLESSGDTDDDRNKRQCWRVKADPGACDECLERDGVVYLNEPRPVHPNCRCGSEVIWMTDKEASAYELWPPHSLCQKIHQKEEGPRRF